MSKKVWWPPAEIAAGHRIDGPNSLIEHCGKCADEVAAWPEHMRRAASVISVTAGSSNPEFPDNSNCPHPILDRGLCVDGKQPCLRCGAQVEAGKVYGPEFEEVAVTSSRSEFQTIEEYQKALKHFNEAARKSYEEFILEHGSDRQKLQLRCTPYTDKKGAYGSTDLDFGIQLWQHQQAVVELHEATIESMTVQGNKDLRELHELQKRVESLENENLDLRVEAGKYALSTFTPPKPTKVGWFACFKKALGADHESS